MLTNCPSSNLSSLCLQYILVGLVTLVLTLHSKVAMEPILLYFRLVANSEGGPWKHITLNTFLDHANAIAAIKETKIKYRYWHTW